MTHLRFSRRRVAKNALSQMLAFGLSGASKAVVAVLVARWLGPYSFGVFTLSWTIVSMLSFFAPLGLDQLLIRELNRSAEKRDIRVALTIACLAGAIFAAAIATGPRLLGAGHDLSAALAAGAPFVMLSAPVLILRGVFHARERMELETFSLAAEGGVSLAAVGFALASGGGVVAAMLALCLGRAANLLVAVVLAKGLFGWLVPSKEIHEWRPLLSMAVPMGFAYIFHTLMLRFDVIMLGFFRSPEDVGLYSAATIIVMTVPIISTAFNTSLYPVLARAKGSDDPALRQVFRTTYESSLVAGLACAAGLSVLAGPLVSFFYGSAFAPSVPVLVALSWVLPLRFINNLSGVALNATDRAGKRTRAIAWAALANIAINLCFIPIWGYQGAAISTVATEIILTVALRKLLRPLAPPVMRAFLSGASLAACSALASKITPGHVFVRAGAGVLLFVALAIGFLWARRFLVLPSQSNEASA